MATLINEPLSRAEAGRLAGWHDTVLLRATREADLETPISTFLALDDGTPAYLLESVEGGERLGRYSFLGRLPRRLLDVRDGVATIRSRPVGSEHPTDMPAVTAAVDDPLDALRSFLPRRRVAPLPELPRFFGGAVGALAYDAVAHFEPTVGLPHSDPVAAPLAAFLETDLVIVFDHLTHTLSAIASVHSDGPDFERRYAVAERALLEAVGTAAAPPRPAPLPAGRSIEGDGTHAPRAADTSLRRDEYLAAVGAAQAAIRDGEAIQIVLARRQSMDATSPTGDRIEGIALYRALRRLSPSPYLFFLRLPDVEVVGASPELLLRVEGGQMVSHPIAGTRPRGSTPAHDAELARELAADRKERSEHVMLVDLARNDLGRVARPGSVVVSRFAQVERFSHVQHLVSHVEADLRPGLDALDALRAVFPAGTLSGAPKVRAMQLIGELERERRGLYGGAVGHLGYDGSLDTAITIRSAVLAGGRIHVHSGAGIVASSVAEREFEETEQKALAMHRAVEMAMGGADENNANGRPAELTAPPAAAAVGRTM